MLSRRTNITNALNVVAPPRDDAPVQVQSLRVVDGQKYADRMDDGQQSRCLWMDAEYLQDCDRGKLKEAEVRFWDALIEKYLKPLESTKQEQAQNAKGLAALRNKIAFSIILLNGLLVLAVFLLQRHKDVLSIQFTPYGESARPSDGTGPQTVSSGPR